MDRSGAVLGGLKSGVGQDTLLTERGHQYIVWVYTMCHRGNDIVTAISELETNLHRFLRHRD